MPRSLAISIDTTDAVAQADGQSKRMVECLSGSAKPEPRGQWRAMRDGNAGIDGTVGNVVSVSYRF
jgi:hypothetical protein